MTIHPHLVELLETYEPEHLNALVNWLDSETESLSDDAHTDPSAQPNPALGLKEETPMSSLSNITFIQAAPSILLSDQVAFSLLNEFGPGFSGKAYFHWLKDCVSNRFHQQRLAQ